MVSQTCCHHADFRDLHSIVVLVRIFVVGSVFSGPMALAIDLADLLIAWAAPSSIRRKTGLPLMMLWTAPPPARECHECVGCYLRSLFVAGALAVLRYAKIHGTKRRPWLTALLARRPTKVAAARAMP